jgi:hypothetical protein
METVLLAIMDQLGQRGDSVCSAEGLIGWWSLIGRGLLRWDLLDWLWGMMIVVQAFLRRLFRDILMQLVLSNLWCLVASGLPCDFKINPLWLLIELFLLTLCYQVSAASSSPAIQRILAVLRLRFRHHSCLAHSLRVFNHGARALTFTIGDVPRRAHRHLI